MAKAVAVVMVTVEEAVEVAMAAAGTEAVTESVPCREGMADAKVVSVVVVSAEAMVGVEKAEVRGVAEAPEGVRAAEVRAGAEVATGK